MNPGLVIEVWIDVLGWTWRTSWQVAVMIILVLVVQAAFGRWLSPRVRYGLWCLVVIRLALPVVPTSPASLFNLASRPVPEARPAAAEPLLTSEAMPAPAAARLTPAPWAREPFWTSAEPALHESGVAAPPAGRSQPFGPASTKGTPWIAKRLRVVLPWVWLGGLSVFGGYLLSSSYRMNRRIGSLRAVTDPLVLEAVEDCRELMQIRVPLTVVETPEVQTPALFGFIRPRLLLPVGMTEGYSPRELRFIFLHELAHLRARDILVNWLVAALQVWHWFNPMVWVALRRWRADREIVRDATALSYLQHGERKVYARTIVRLLCASSVQAPLPALAGILEDPAYLKRRIAAIGCPGPSQRTRWLGWMLLAAMAVTTFTDASRAPGRRRPAWQEGATAHLPQENGISFRVLQSDTALGVPGARLLVTFSREDETSVELELEADAEGHCRVPIPVGLSDPFELRVAIAGDGYVSKIVRWSTVMGDDIDDLPREIEVRLAEAGSSGGWVGDSQGRGVGGVAVVIRPMDGAAMREMETPGVPFHVESTDVAGRWTCRHLSDRMGPLTLQFLHPDHRPAVAQCLPPADALPGLAESTTLTLSAVIEGNAVMVLEPGLSWSGRVVDKAERPVAGARVTRSRYQDLPFMAAITGSDGSVRFDNLAPDEAPLLVEATGYAARTCSIPAPPGGETCLIRLRSWRPLTGRVIDEANRPIAGALVEVAPGGPYHWRGRTDMEGRFRYDAAPEETLDYRVSAPPTFRPATVRWTADGADRLVTLERSPGYPRIRVIGRVSEDNTGAPVPRFAVLLHREVAHGLDRWTLAPELVAEGMDGGFRVSIEWPTDAYDLEVHAEGYLPKRSGWYPRRGGNRRVDLVMSRGTDVTGTAWLPDGEPAVGAQVGLSTPDQRVILGGRKLLYPERSRTTTVDAGGRFAFSAQGGEFNLIAAHEQGYREISAAAFYATRRIELEPWGRIDGRLELEGTGLPGCAVWLRSTTDWLDRSPQVSLNPSGAVVITAEDGTFSFPSVPRGEYAVYPVITNAYARGTRVSVEPGSSVRMQVAFERAGSLTGRLMWLAGGPAVRWNSPNHRFSLTGRPASDANPNLAETGRDAEGGLVWLDFLVEPDGSFRLEGIPEGTYEIRAWVALDDTDPSGSVRSGGQTRGVLTREVSVTRADPRGPGAPLDLGMLEVQALGPRHLAPAIHP